MPAACPRQACAQARNSIRLQLGVRPLCMQTCKPESSGAMIARGIDRLRIRLFHFNPPPPSPPPPPPTGTRWVCHLSATSMRAPPFPRSPDLHLLLLGPFLLLRPVPVSMQSSSLDIGLADVIGCCDIPTHLPHPTRSLPFVQCSETALDSTRDMHS